MTRTLYLHCGPAKTGTSAIQAYLRDNSHHPDLLYPQTGQWGDGAHHHLAFALQGMTARGPVQVEPLDRLHGALTAELAASDARDMLISSEGLTPKDALPAFHREFADLVAGFDRVVTLVVLRHPLERAASAYNQNIKDQVIAEKRLPDAYLAEAGPGFALMPLVRRWQRAVPGVTFLSYHPAKRLLHRFMRALDRDFTETGGRTRRNRSLGGRAALTLLLGNRLTAGPAERAALFAALRRDDKRSVHQGSSYLFSAAATRACLAELSPDLQALRDTLGIDLTGLYPDPPPRFTLGPQQAAGLRRRLAPLAPDAERKAEIERIAGVFERPDDASAPGDGAAEAR